MLEQALADLRAAQKQTLSAARSAFGEAAETVNDLTATLDGLRERLASIARAPTSMEEELVGTEQNLAAPPGGPCPFGGAESTRQGVSRTKNGSG